MGDYEIGREVNVARNLELSDALGITGKGGLFETVGDKRKREEAAKQAAQELRQVNKQKKATAAAAAEPTLRRVSGRLNPSISTPTPAPMPTHLTGKAPTRSSLEPDPATAAAAGATAASSTASFASSARPILPDPVPPVNPKLLPLLSLAPRPFTGEDFTPLEVLVNTKGWPTWMDTYHQYLSHSEWGAPWATTVTAWSELERNYKFITPVSFFYAERYSIAHYLSRQRDSLPPTGQLQLPNGIRMREPSTNQWP